CNQHSFTMVAMSHNHVVAICNLYSQLSPAKSMRKLNMQIYVPLISGRGTYVESPPAIYYSIQCNIVTFELILNLIVLPVIWGVAMQFVLGLITLRTKIGFDAFNWLGNQVQIFLGYTDAGAKFVFGEKYTDHFFAFKVLPIIIFFSTVMSVLYHVGFMQWLIKKVGWIMQITLQTSPVESLVAAGNIFSESPLMVKPYLPYVTKSELHAIMTAGFATIAGSVLGAYISFGVSASHLLTASVMSAPAALAVAKLFWPETEKPQINAQEDTKMEKGEARNLLEAASQGASAAIPLVANIAVNLIAFLALLAFFNAVLSWLGNMFDYPQLSFEIICSYLFMPFSFMMGVDWEDSFIVGGLLGYKTFFNEFVAYEHLSISFYKEEVIGLLFALFQIRSETIATYALCGFANFGSVGMVLGALCKNHVYFFLEKNRQYWGRVALHQLRIITLPQMV
uniref:Solute carrier family 28 member 3 n=1 Tax=Pseudonaja textilis TaxID=8673 RepID=A0A670YYT8_PSETE